MRKINKLGRRAAAMALAISLTLSTAAPVLAADADEVQTPAAQTEQQETDTEADEADVDTEADEAAALPELSEDREVAEEDEAVALPELSEDRAVAEEDEAAALPELSEDREVAEEDEAVALPELSEDREVAEEDEAAADGDADERALHYWKKDHVVAPTCTKKGYTVEKCRLHKGETRQTNWKDPLGHLYTKYTVTKEATEGADGEQVAVCDRRDCGAEDKQIIHYYGEWKVTKEPTCYAKGEKQRVCVNCSHVDIEEIDMIAHTWSTKYVNDNKPACQQQTESLRCTVCGAKGETRDRANLGSDGNPLPHKYTSYEYDTTKWENNKLVIYYKSKCDYCGHEDNTFTGKEGEIAADGVSGGLTDTALKNVKVNEKTADAYVTGVINDALAQAQKKVQKAETKEQALAALDEISATVTKELQDLKISVAGSNGVPIEIDPEKLNSALKPLYSTIDELKNSLDDSFLSKDTIVNVVDKLAGDVQGSDAPQAGIQKVLYNTVYGAIYKGITGKDAADNNTQVVSDMVLQLVQEVVSNGDEETWKKLTNSLVNDALDLAVDELMKDETYAKLLKTKLGKATLKEVEDEVRKQLVNDPEFMNQVRSIANNAASNAQERVNGGWPTEKIMDGLQKDLLPGVTDLVSNQVNKLGASAGDIVDNKVSDTVHKFLPGKLGDWVSDKIGGKVNDAVTGKVDDLNKQVTDLISSTIKQLTCGKHEYGDFEILKNPTCTEKGQKGKICKKCGKITEKTDIDATGHAPVTDPAVAPTETTDGLTEGSHCGVCGAVLQAQEVIPMLDPTIDTWFSRAATTEADAKAAGFDSVDAANAALDAALTAAGFDPANAEHFTVQVNSSIGVLPNDRYPEDGVTCKLTLPQATKGQMAQEYYLVQMCTADGRFRKAGDIIVTPVRMDTYDKNGLKFTAYSQSIVALAWKPLY